MPSRAQRSAMAAAVASLISAPVGLPGELRTIALVRGVTRARMASASTWKPSSRWVRTSTGVAPSRSICSTMVGQNGVWVITSSPGSKSATAALNSACLPPAVAITSAGVKATP